MTIAFFDSKRHFEARGADLQAAVAGVLASGRYIGGPVLSQFEDAFAEYCGTRHCVGNANGTAAVHLALLALNVGPGDEVITVASTFAATVEAILYTGATPVLVDADEDTGGLDPKALASAITDRTKAIVPVHLFGQLGRIADVLDVATAADIPVLEDACQAHGATALGRRAGSLGTVGCFSFYPAKNLGACGDAGALVTDDDDLAAHIRSLLDHGQTMKYRHQYVGFNYRLDSIQAAVLATRLEDLERENAARRALAEIYDEALDDLPLVLPRRDDDDGEVFHLYVVRTPKRDALQDFLTRHGVETAIHYPVPVHLQPAYASLGHSEGDFPVAELRAADMLSLPMYPELTADEARTVSARTRQFFTAS